MNTVKGWKWVIGLTGGRVALVDKADYAAITTMYPWCIVRGRNGDYYAARSGLLLHRHLVGLSKGDSRVVDHINGDTLDNRRSNLRICTSRQNLCNTGISKRNRSGFKGVSYDSARGKWFASIGFNNRRVTIGRFDTREEAALAYNSAAIKHHGEFAWQNKVI